MDDADALGPPAKMRERRGELTPMLSQYLDLCERYPDSLVLFQVGDFYETFCEAAEVTARLLEITLTKREDSTGRYPMAGIPVDSAESYIETLLDAGYRVAVADQVQEPSETTGVVDRAVTRIVTPGTLTEDAFLDDDNVFVAALADGDDHGAERGLAVLDVSTGDFYATGGEAGAVADEIQRFAPAEAVIAPGLSADAFDGGTMVTPFRPDAFDPERAGGKVADYFGDPDTVLGSTAEVRACGALLAYAEYTRAGEADRLDYLNHLTRYDPREYLLLDATALRSLELFERRALGGEASATLFDTVNETASALGARRLTDWLRRPLLDEGEIAARHDAVGELVSDVVTRESLHDDLRDVYDVERLVSRVSRGRANARDLRSLKSTLDVVPRLREALSDADSDRLRDLRERLDPCEDVRARIGSALVAEPPIELTEGGLIDEGYDADLDDLRATEREGKAWIDDLEADERERTGIDSLKVGVNQVHGYYIEVTNPNLDAVPDDYQRRQTLKNSERFVTPELKEREEEIVTAEERADDLEYALFTDLRDEVAAETERIQAVADALAALDALQSLATVAAERDYTRPELGADGFHIEGGRHPVVERTQPNFVPNPTDLDRGTVAVITGPNMAGKSTYMRQVALIQVLVQAGSFVPAEAASLPVVDRVFTRVGASDDIAGGRSTFMVEMTELATILRAASEESLVLLDEVGRGTSTTDGLALARATVEHVHDVVGATTLFATHHHELTATADRLDRARNLHFAADGTGEAVDFTHRLREGPAGASYGVEVARSAGVPDPVVSRAHELLDREGAAATPDEPAVAANGGVDEAVFDRLRRTDIANTTPLEALDLLAELKAATDE
ncbi:DNA mismatch repair protein MutS [Halosegnis marinus]|uniref:DNA mismatch repair protein MutS n=1 Tax=Halosegnis marinus TaxID=3034023 RepID=A0ABD5ZN63_9EURY|nr:DNA mismatch repair protein MutS [Halosegnis sp. DT85]